MYRSLSRNPSYVAAAVLSLGLGIGANTAIFTLADQMLLRSLPVQEPQRLALFKWTGNFIGGTSRGWDDTFSYPMFRDLQGSNPGVLTGIAARFQDTADIASSGPAQRATVELVSGNFFEVLGVKAAVGRTLTGEDDRIQDGSPYVVLSYDYWQRQFAGEPSVLNRVVRINRNPMTIVGVAQRGFRGFDTLSPSDFFVPLAMKAAITPTWDDRQRRDSIWLKIFGRLRPGVDASAAQSALLPVYRHALESDLKANARPQDFAQRYLKGELRLADASKGFSQTQQFFAKPLYVMLAMVGLLLLIACANVANLLITRAASRQKEIAIRLSLGATRASLIRLIMTESLFIALCSGAAGLLLADWIASALVRMVPFPNFDLALHTTPDARILVFTLSVSVLTALLFGMAPAFQASRLSLMGTLKSEAGSVSTGTGQTRLRRVLVVAQVGLSLLLLICAGLFARSLYTLLTVDSGMKTSSVLSFSIDASLQGYTPERTRRLFLDLQSRMQQLAGVSSVSGSSFAVLARNNWQNTVHVEGYQARNGEDMNPGWNQVMPGFFSTMGVPLLAGREFTERDIEGGPKVVIVNESFARRFLPRDNPLGRHLGWGDSGPVPFEIVGVVKDLKGGDLREQAKPWTYTPVLQDAKPSALTVYLRVDRNPEALGTSALQVVRQLDSSLPVQDLKTVETQIAETHFLDRLFAWLSCAFGLLATLLASIGLYGITAYSVTRRTQEIGIRVALGAEKRSVLSLIMKEVLVLTACGVSIGVPAALLLARLVESQLFGVKARDPLVVVGAVLVITLVSCLAGYVPARRATTIDPIRALRYE